MTTRYVFSNFMVGELLDNILAETTEIRIAPSVAAMLQLFNPGDNLEARFTLWDGQEDPEIVGCIGNAQTGTLIVNRAQENTTARNWPAGTQVRCALTAAVINQALLASVDTQALLASQFLPLTGGTVSGPILLPEADPTVGNEATTKSYVDNVQGNKLPVTGGTMTGSINMNGNRILTLSAPVAATEPARKAETDALALVQTKMASDRSGVLTSTGTAEAFQVTTNTGYTSLADGMTIRAKLHEDASDSATLQIDTTAAKPIHRTPGTVISAGDGQQDVPYDFVFSTGYDAWLISGSHAEWETGDVKLTFRTSVGPNWRLMDDGSIGDATSGATFASANARALFLTLYDAVSDAWAPVNGGRGASAAADWAAHKRMSLTKVLGRALIAAGGGSELTTRVLGEFLGVESNVLSYDNFPVDPMTVTIAAGQGSHNHTLNNAYIGGGGGLTNGTGTVTYSVGTATVSTATLPEMEGVVDVEGLGTALTNMQPSSAFNVAIHL